ncbi:hypothetical protein RUND412_009589 [Rhizina undulata]
MDRLPNEILQEIVSHLFASDLDSMRLVSRGFSAAANIFKFRALRVRVTRKGLDNLLNISRHPHLAQCVREITYPFDRLTRLKSPCLEEDDLPYPPGSLLGAIKDLAKSFFWWYMERYIAQIDLEKSGECARSLETAISKMANIRTVITGYNFDMHGEFHHWRKTLNKVDRSCVDQWSEHRYFVFEAIQEKEGAIIDLIHTTHRLGCKLDRLDFTIGCCWLRLGTFYNNSKLWDCASLLENLTYLSISITVPVNFEDLEAVKKVSKEGKLHKFYSFAPNLKNLTLELESMEESTDELMIFAGSDFKSPVISLLDIFGRGHVWKYLESLNLCFPCIVVEELVEFLALHGSTLKYLHMASPVLLNETWRDLLDFLKERLDIKDLLILSPCEMLLGEEPQFRCYNAAAQLKMQDYVLLDEEDDESEEEDDESEEEDDESEEEDDESEEEEVGSEEGGDEPKNGEDEPEEGEEEPEEGEDELEKGEDEPEEAEDK